MELAVCNGKGRDVFIFNYDTSLSPEENTPNLQIKNAIWKWHPSKSNLPSEDSDGAKVRNSFRGIDECKPVLDLKYILVTSSWDGGGMALIRRADQKAVYYATGVTNAHSAEILPDGNIVVACSGKEGFLRVFEVDKAALDAGKLQSPKVSGKDVPLPWGHGVVWDRKRKCLWALGGNEILQLSYSVNDGAATLTITSRTDLPERGGHDLFPILGGKDQLMISTSTKNWLLDPAKMKFTEFTRIPHQRVKSMNRLPGCDLLVTVKGEKRTAGLSLIFSATVGTETRVPVEGATFYKARWFVPNDFSYPPEVRATRQ